MHVKHRVLVLRTVSLNQYFFTLTLTLSLKGEGI